MGIVLKYSPKGRDISHLLDSRPFADSVSLISWPRFWGVLHFWPFGLIALLQTLRKFGDIIVVPPRPQAPPEWRMNRGAFGVVVCGLAARPLPDPDLPPCLFGTPIATELIGIVESFAPALEPF